MRAVAAQDQQSVGVSQPQPTWRTLAFERVQWWVIVQHTAVDAVVRKPQTGGTAAYGQCDLPRPAGRPLSQHLMRKGTQCVIATRQIYANHYFSATLELRTLIDDDDAAAEDDGFFLLYATRSRVTGLSGFFKGLLRAIVKRRARSGMERYLTNTQAVIEGRSPGDH